jgi:hypothetical protein
MNESGWNNGAGGYTAGIGFGFDPESLSSAGWVGWSGDSMNVDSAHIEVGDFPVSAIDRNLWIVIPDPEPNEVDTGVTRIVVVYDIPDEHIAVPTRV